MARMPGAVWKPLASNYASQGAIRSFDLICIHTMVGSLTGTDSYFRSGNGAGFAGTESHFGTGPFGEITQWQDTAYRADANLDGNYHILSIENADVGAGYPKWNLNNGAEVPAFTELQCEAIAKILAWAYKTHGIPLVLVPDSKPGRRGVCYHAQGVDPGRVAGGEKWSSAYGKVCPGARRIAQIPGIIKRARVIAGLDAGAVTPNPEEDMPSAKEVAEEVVKQLLAADVSEDTPGKQTFARVAQELWLTSRSQTALLRASAAREAAQAATIRELAKVVADREGFDPLEVEQAAVRAIDSALAGKVVLDVDEVDVNVTPKAY